MYIHVNIFKIYTVCVYLYIHNKYTQYTHIYYVNKNFYKQSRLIVLYILPFKITAFYFNVFSNLIYSWIYAGL